MKKLQALLLVSFLILSLSAFAATTQKQLTLTVAPPPLVITTSSLPGAQESVAYTPVQLTATGGVAPYTWSATGLPSGMAVSASGSLSGTPGAGTSTSSPYTVNVQVVDSLGTTAQLSIPLGSLPVATLGQRYKYRVLAAGGIPPYTWSLGSVGGLPPGLTFSTDGTVSGIPTSTGYYVATYIVKDSGN